MREHILELLKRRTATIDDPIFGVIHVRELDTQERFDAIRLANRGTPDEPNYDDRRYFAFIVHRTLTDEHGALLFGADTLDALADMKSDRLSALAQHGIRLSEAAPGDMKSGGDSADGGQPDADGGAESTNG